MPGFDPSLTNKLVILADTKDGKPLTSSEGPFHVIVADEKRQMRWMKFAASMTVARVPWADPDCGFTRRTVKQRRRTGLPLTLCA